MAVEQGDFLPLFTFACFFAFASSASILCLMDEHSSLISSSRITILMDSKCTTLLYSLGRSRCPYSSCEVINLFRNQGA